MLNVLAVQSPTICTNCEDQTMANSRCLDCVENLCADCVGAHGRIRQTKDHKIVSFDDLQNNAIHDAVRCPSFCYVHDREMLKYYCATCDDAICRDCAIYDHREHSYIDLAGAVKSHRPVITSLLEDTSKKTPIIKNALNEVMEVEESLIKRRDQVRKLINQVIDEHVQLLEEKRRKLLENVESVFQAKDKVLKDQQSILEMDLSNLISSCDFVESVLNYGNEAEVMAAKKLMTNRLQALMDHKSQIEPEENDVIEFNPTESDMTSAISKFGHIATSTAFPSLCIAEGHGLSQAKVNQAISVKVIARNRCGMPTGQGGDSLMAILTDSSDNPVSGDIDDLGNGIYNITYKPNAKGRHSLSIQIREKPIIGSPFEVNVSAGLELQRIGPLQMMIGQTSANSPSKSSDESYEPWGVAANDNGLIAITDHYNHRVQIFDDQGNFLYQFGNRGKSDGEMWYPTGISFDAAGNIYVADHGNHRIQIFTEDGEFIRRFGTRGTGDSQLKGPCGIVVDYDDRVVIADRDNHRVQVFHSDGSYLFQFGGYGSADGKLNSPRHVAVTTDNKIIVSDTNNYRIQVFDREGLYLSKFGGKGSLDGQFLCPSGVGVDSEDHVVIADFKNLDIQIFSIEGKFLKRFGNEGVTGNLNKPTGLDVSLSGSVLVADRGMGRVQVF